MDSYNETTQGHVMNPVNPGGNLANTDSKSKLDITSDSGYGGAIDSQRRKSPVNAL